MPYALTLYKSLVRFNKEEKLIVLVVDNAGKLPSEEIPGISFISIDTIYTIQKADVIYNKYGETDTDALRWGFKPVLISFLLDKGFTKVIYADCDLFFFNGYEFLFSELDQYATILTPGRTTRSPQVHEEEFLSGYKYGQFNAGLIGATERSIPMLKWWAECCAYRIETNFLDGLFVDQKYLDAVPVLFENIGIIKHKGCNIAFWNQHECKREFKENRVWINGEFPIIFIHFNSRYIPELLNGNDPLIYPYYLEYERTFSESGKKLTEFIPGAPEYKTPTLLVRVKRKLLLRTRIKRWLFKLSQK
ncbi:MAG: hypothetical protein ABL876_07060 [Chitinophagaceae bacterium]